MIMETTTLNGQTFAYQGNLQVLQQPATAFLSSMKSPDSAAEAAVQWLREAAPACLVCGILSAIERRVLREAVMHDIPAVMALATPIPNDLAQLHLDYSILEAVRKGRLLVVAPLAEEEGGKVSGKSSALRNELMIALARQVVVAYMTENGHLARQLLRHPDVKVLTQSMVPPQTDDPQAQNNAMQMGWAIYNKLKSGNLASVEMRQLLNQYLHLPIEKPSMLHSLMLFVVLKHYAGCSDFNFTAFFRLWGKENLRAEDWKAEKADGKWLPSLTERVLARLFKALPSKFRQPVNQAEKFDPELAHFLLDKSLARVPKNKRNLQRALNLAYFEHDSPAIAKYRQILGKE